MARYDVFFSYSRADTERVAPLRDALRGMGYRVFFDEQSIDPSSPWRQRLRQAIRGSRSLVLCWSESAHGSDYVNFEYMQAEALHKPIFPWRLDKAPLPPMLEAQAIASPSAAEVAAKVKPILGWPLRKRRGSWLAVAAVAAALLGAAAWRLLHPPPPPPWHFQGEVIDRNTSMPIAGAEVDVFTGDHVQEVFTNGQGQFDLILPPPQPPYIHVRFRKDGYQPEEPFDVTTGKRLEEDMAKQP